MSLKRVSTVICDDVLRNVGGWLSLYSLFREVYGREYPCAVRITHPFINRGQ